MDGRASRAISGINVQLPAAHQIRGHVYGPGHVALAGAGVSAKGNHFVSPSADTAADGSFILHGVPHRTYQVEFLPPDGANLLSRWYGASASSQDPTGASDVVVSGGTWPASTPHSSWA